MSGFGRRNTPDITPAMPAAAAPAAATAPTAPSKGSAEAADNRLAERDPDKDVAVSKDAPQMDSELQKTKEMIYATLMEQIDLPTASRLKTEDLRRQVTDRQRVRVRVGLWARVRLRLRVGLGRLRLRLRVGLWTGIGRGAGRRLGNRVDRVLARDHVDHHATGRRPGPGGGYMLWPEGFSLPAG